MDSRFKEWVYIEGLMQSAYHEAALKMNLSDSEFWILYGEKRDCQPNQCGHVHQRRVYPVPGSLRGGAELLVHVVGVPAGGAYAHHQGACAGRLDERPSG